MSDDNQLSDIVDKWRGAGANESLTSLAKTTADAIRRTWTGNADSIKDLMVWLEDIQEGQVPSSARVRSIYLRLEKVRAATPDKN